MQISKILDTNSQVNFEGVMKMLRLLFAFVGSINLCIKLALLNVLDVQLVAFNAICRQYFNSLHALE